VPPFSSILFFCFLTTPGARRRYEFRGDLYCIHFFYASLGVEESCFAYFGDFLVPVFSSPQTLVPFFAEIQTTTSLKLWCCKITSLSLLSPDQVSPPPFAHCTEYELYSCMLLAQPRDLFIFSSDRGALVWFSLKLEIGRFTLCLVAQQFLTPWPLSRHVLPGNREIPRKGRPPFGTFSQHFHFYPY